MSYNFLDDESYLLQSGEKKTLIVEEEETELKKNPFFQAEEVEEDIELSEVEASAAESYDATYESDEYEETDYDINGNKNKKTLIFILLGLVLLAAVYFSFPIVSSLFETKKVEKKIANPVKKDSIKVKAIAESILRKSGTRQAQLKQMIDILSIKASYASLSQINLSASELYIELTGKDRSSVAAFGQKLRSTLNLNPRVLSSQNRNSPNGGFMLLYNAELNVSGKANFKQLQSIADVEKKLNSIVRSSGAGKYEISKEQIAGLNSFFIKFSASKATVRNLLSSLNAELNNVELLKFSAISSNQMTLSDKELLVRMRFNILN